MNASEILKVFEEEKLWQDVCHIINPTRGDCEQCELRKIIPDCIEKYCSKGVSNSREQLTNAIKVLARKEKLEKLLSQ